MPKHFFNASPDARVLAKLTLNQLKIIDKALKEEIQDRANLLKYEYQLMSLMIKKDYDLIGMGLRTHLINTLNQVKSLLDALPDSHEEAPEVIVQIPSTEDMSNMSGMLAGIDEDQSIRLQNMTHILKSHASIPLTTTQNPFLSEAWHQLFHAIDNENYQTALERFKQIPQDDPVLRPLLQVHSIAYIKRLILASIQARRYNGIRRINMDVVVRPKTFEILIRDLATTLESASKLIFSFGLPTHHAYSDESSGFCLINKTAVLIKDAELTSSEPLKVIIVGIDVNRDDGLCDMLRSQLSQIDICHIDVFDSRVYPYDNKADIDREFNNPGLLIDDSVYRWEKNKMQYLAVDLSKAFRETESTGIHPALMFALSKVKEQIDEAIANHQKIAIYLPTGWDSHQNETADCSKLVDEERRLSEEESAQCRFTSREFAFFNHHLLRLYRENKEHIHAMYWGLEGGYDQAMYSLQVDQLMESIENHLRMEAPQPSSSIRLD